ALEPEDPDEDWHRVRILAKRARYAADAMGDKPRAKALAAVQDLLGEHQDAAVAAETWLGYATHPALAGTGGHLYSRERGRLRAARAASPALWKRFLG